MLTRFLNWSGAGLAVAVLVAAPTALAGQAQAPTTKKPASVNGGGDAATRKKFVLKRLPWGDPDLSGNYTTKDEANTPFQRPEEFAGKRIEDITAAELEKANAQRRRQALADAPFPGGGSPQRGVAIAVPIHWFDSLDTNNARPWFVVDPPDGHIPPQTDEAQQRAAARAAARRGRGLADSYTDRSTNDRCIAWNIGAGRVLPTLYGNSVQILQTKDFVAIRYEMVHETRIIPIGGRGAARPHNGSTLRSYYGDAIAHWEGDTLVVDTTNYNGRVNAGFFAGGQAPLGSQTLHTIEKFTRIGPNKLEFSATFDDPHTWTRPWTFSLPWTEDDTQPIFEYACHEGNYGLRNILSAGRSDDRKGIKSSDSVDTQEDLNEFEP
jgi:hypothetical protein